jgi:hypothetical protein
MLPLLPFFFVEASMDASHLPAKDEIGVENDEIVDANLRNFIITQFACTCFSICSVPDINGIR